MKDTFDGKNIFYTKYIEFSRKNNPANNRAKILQSKIREQVLRFS